MRHPRVWFAAAPPGGPPEKPRRLLRAGLGPGTVERESGKSRVARWTGAFFLLASALARHTPSLGGTGKETGSPAPDQGPGPAWRWLCVDLPSSREIECCDEY